MYFCYSFSESGCSLLELWQSCMVKYFLYVKVYIYGEDSYNR